MKNVPSEKLIRKEHHPEIIIKAKEAGLFDEMQCDSRYINIKRFFRNNPRMRLIDKRLQINGERFQCDVIVRQPESKEKAIN